MNNFTDERRAEQRVSAEGFHSVEISVPELNAVYQFRLWDLSAQGLCFLVRAESPVLSFLEVGSVLPMKFYSGGIDPPQDLRAEIRHVSPAVEGRFRNHTLVGVSILKEASTRTALQ